MIVRYEELIKVMIEKLVSRGVDEKEASICATLMANNSLDGVYSHGVNRFARLIEYIDKGYIDVKAKPEKIASIGSFERWDGHLALGPNNAKLAMDRAIEIARKSGIGIVAIRNTNHWMRGGSYGWQAAESGMIGICWTNTMPNMPAWGAKDNRIGNNPFVMAVPRENGEHVVLDSAMSQFSYGKLEMTALQGKPLPVPGGFDEEGNLSTDAGSIFKTRRVLPIGYWKGSGMSILLDLIASVLSDGDSVSDVGTREGEYGLSQVLIAIDPKCGKDSYNSELVERVLENVTASIPAEEGKEIRYPGQNSYKTRIENLKNGIPVVDSVWEKIISL
ncbi:MAG: 3-dehydro-L-gulonate 2-dehydrogenase [Sphaerochaetaceae bacterium]|nr:3-dehydro-L-gulonate 2-dehydrogenase [Sphaerochaetaceae bacterium]